MTHWFITPRDIFSPRWQQAFVQAQIVDEVPADFSTTDMVWLLLKDEQSFAQIERLTAAGVKVVAMTAIEHPLEARQSLAQGACGYVHYLAVPQVLKQIEQVIAAGGLWLGAALMRQIVAASATLIQPSVTNSLQISLLSGREKAVAELVVAGKSNKEVARELAITERTVKAHLSAVFEKLKVRDRLQLVLLLSGK